MFETTLNPKERHINGMHYTSPRNIHRVIDKLFLNDLTNELNAIKTKYGNTAEASSKAKKFQDKLASLTFLDPACGSGNFLTETYLCLRKLENQAIKLRLNNNGQFNIELLGGNKLIEVHITQFHGIEINDFAVSVAKTAMWIAESQMIKETQYIVGEQINSLPLTSNPNIIEANALETDWSKAVNPDDLNYIISNPPFAGDRKDKQQKQDMKDVMKGFKSIGKLDLVSAWYKKSADMLLKNKNIHIALVSTNNITNGIQVYPLWSRLINKYHVHINFAYRMFKWQNSAKHQAVVYCVIIGFSLKDEPQKEIVGSNGRTYHAKHISPYLYELPNILVSSANKPLSPNIPKMRSGSKPTDKGKLSRYSDKKKNEICSKYPSAQKLFKRFVGASEFLKNKTRWCLWLKGVDTKDWINIPPIYKAVQEVKQYRKGSHDKATQRSASVPYLFQAIRQPDTDYLLVPSHTSMHRRYVPVGYFNKNVIVNNSSLYIPNATKYMFGILESRLHTLWVSLVSGRFGPSFRYSAKITYNNFPWISVTKEQKQTISKTAQDILNTRANHHGDSLSDLYDTSAMPIDLQKAHQANDKAVRRVYGITKNMSKDQIFTKLLKMYSKLKQNR